MKKSSYVVDEISAYAHVLPHVNNVMPFELPKVAKNSEKIYVYKFLDGGVIPCILKDNVLTFKVFMSTKDSTRESLKKVMNEQLDEIVRRIKSSNLENKNLLFDVNTRRLVNGNDFKLNDTPYFGAEYCFFLTTKPKADVISDDYKVYMYSATVPSRAQDLSLFTMFMNLSKLIPIKNQHHSNSQNKFTDDGILAFSFISALAGGIYEDDLTKALEGNQHIVNFYRYKLHEVFIGDLEVLGSLDTFKTTKMSKLIGTDKVSDNIDTSGGVSLSQIIDVGLENVLKRLPFTEKVIVNLDIPDSEIKTMTLKDGFAYIYPAGGRGYQYYIDMFGSEKVLMVSG